MINGFSIALFEQHAQMLADSGITAQHAFARGYVSVDTKVRLQQLSITKAGRNVPGLLLPQLRKDGSTWGYQYRPDVPRLRDGKPVKYETPAGQRNGIDVPPGVGADLDDPAVPLWVTEGVKKADAAALAGLCCVALPGVWSWRGDAGKGGKVAVPDWHDVALNDRRVILAFDSDVVRKAAVRGALDALSGYLASKGAKVEYLHLPDDDVKTGLDDYLTAGHDVDQLHRLVRPEPPARECVPVQPVQPVQPVSLGGSGVTGKPETAAVLDDVRAWFARFLCTVDETDLDLLVLWAAHTHLVVETYTTPRLLFDSPVPGSGKTTAIEHLERLCLHPVQMASLSSPALLTRMLDAGLRTILIDEADRSLNPERDGVAELLAVLNSGYKRGGTRPVLVPTKDGWTVSEMPTYAPVAMAGNNPNLPEDTRSRSLRVLLMPDVDGVAEESDWEWIDDDARTLGCRLSVWADQVRDQVRATRPLLPESVKGRARERWSPLKRVATAAGGRWPQLVDTLAREDVKRFELEREEGIVQQRPHVVLLAHIHHVFGADETFVATEDLIDRLVDAHPDIWGDLSTFGKRLTPQRLGRMLSTGYKIHTSRPDANGRRGYLRVSLETAFRRFGLDPSAKPAELAESVEPALASVPNLGLGTRPGRCLHCGFHIATQGHRAGCSTTPVSEVAS